ncbi:MAG TPA: hypothetical protein VIM96_07725 [Pseudomonadales bacterium]
MLIVLVVLTLSVIAGFNRLIDPYGFFGDPVIEGVNAHKFRFTALEPETKLRAFSRQRPSAIVLGTSRAALGIPMQSAQWGNQPVYNLAYAGAGSRSLASIARYAFRQPDLKTAVLMLDFFSFNADYSANNTEDARYQSIQDLLPGSGNDLRDAHLLLPTLLSMQAFRDSLFTLQKQSMNRRHLDSRGNWVGPGIGHFQPQSILFNDIERESLDLQYFPPPTRRLALHTNNYSTLDDFRSIITAAHRHNIHLVIGVSPRHVRLQALLQAAGANTLLAEWQQALADINQTEAFQAGRPPFPLIDFSGLSDYTTETIAPANDKTTKLQWFIDPGHYTPELGAILLQQLLTNTPDGTLGRALHSANAHALHQHDMEALSAWLTTHPDIAQIAGRQWQRFLNQAPAARVESLRQ